MPTPFERTYRGRLFPLAGLLLAMGAPAGLLAVRALAGGSPTLAWLSAELASQAVTYVYVALSTAAAFVLLGWQLGRKADRLRLTSVTDPLTSLYNRRHCDDHLRAELARAERYGTPLSLVLLDVDGLKGVNDRGGHLAGDAALRRVACALRQGCRASDLVARYGGDEFAMILPHARATEALELAGRVLATLRAGGPAATTVSAGIADLDRCAKRTADELCRTADLALYEAKRAGRDRAVVAPLEPRDIRPRRARPAGAYHPKESPHAPREARAGAG